MNHILGESTDTMFSSDPAPPTLEWLKIDSIIPSCIFTTLSKTLQSRLVVENPKTTKEAWDIRAEIFNENKWSRSISLKAEFRSLKLGDLSIDAYFRKIESIATILSSLGLPPNKDDIDNFLLIGCRITNSGNVNACRPTGATEFALMAISSLSSENEPCCSKACKKNTDSLNSKITDLSDKLSDKLKVLQRFLEELMKKKEGLDTKLIGFQSASKDLDTLIGSQRSDKNKDGLRYSAVPPFPAQVYSPPKKDMFWTGLSEFADDTITDYSRPSPAIESISDDLQNRNPSITETKASSSTILSKPAIKFVKAPERPTKIKTNKVETLKKPAVKYAEMYRKTSKSSNALSKKISSKNSISSSKGSHCYPKIPTVNRKFPTVSRKFLTGNTKFSTADLGNKRKAVKASACWIWKPSQNSTNKGPNSNCVSVMFKKYTYIDTQGRLNGCSRHMTGNISYLSNYEPFDGGYVSFGQGGCKITSKGTIKIGKIEFKNVYFVKDLKYNMLNVSQIFDNKSSVLFTDSECIVLGRNFKLTEDTNMFLRTPRQHNMYSINLNNVVPHKDLTCLVAKASADECMLWHKRLGHLNIKTMNRLVRHNFVRGLPSKCFDNDHTCVACLKGKQHKAFCKTKLVNSVTKPLHTLHMDLFGPTSDETSGILRDFIGNKMHKAFPLLGESSHWQYKFPLPVNVVPTARRLEMPLPGVCTAIEEMMKKLSETKVATWDDLAFKLITLGWNVPRNMKFFAKMLIQS
nr:putative ribonuclease H-like domain-containing protein [Tanacetum cinerariifolium]